MKATNSNIMNVRQLIILISILTFIFSCSVQNSFVETRMMTVDKFVECLINNTPDKILRYTLRDVDDNIDNKESRHFHVNLAYKLINKFGLPPKEKWIIKHDPQNYFERLLVTIPIFKGYDSASNLLQADIVMKFPPPQISKKIYSFDVNTSYEMKQQTPLLSPQAVDKSKKGQ